MHTTHSGQRNQFPQHYAQISQELLPAELFPQHAAVEYTLSVPVPGPPVFLFVLDLALRDDEIEVRVRVMNKCSS